MPDFIVNNIIENRLKQSDCKVNGWIMDGFPETESQMNLLKALRIKPMCVFIFEQHLDECKRRLSNRRIDPATGMLYNLEIQPPSDEATSNRIIQQQEDMPDVVEKKFKLWEKQCPKIED